MKVWKGISSFNKMWIQNKKVKFSQSVRTHIMNALPPFESTVCLTISRMPLCWSPSNLNPKVFWGRFFKTTQRKILMFLVDVVFAVIHLKFLGGDKKELLGNQNIVWLQVCRVMHVWSSDLLRKEVKLILHISKTKEIQFELMIADHVQNWEGTYWVSVTHWPWNAIIALEVWFVPVPVN